MLRNKVDSIDCLDRHFFFFDLFVCLFLFVFFHFSHQLFYWIFFVCNFHKCNCPFIWERGREEVDYFSDKCLLKEE